MNVLKIRLGLLCLVMFANFILISPINSQCTCNDTLTNPSASSIFGTATTITGFCKKISGTFTIDHDMEFINSNLDMLELSKIIISANATLTFKNTKAIKCGTQWAGIKFTNSLSNFVMKDSSKISGANIGIEQIGGSVIITNSIISDTDINLEIDSIANLNVSNSQLANGGFYGILIKENSKVNLNITNTLFANNSVSIYGKSSTLSSTITNCQFDHSFHAIWLETCTGYCSINFNKFTNQRGYAIRNSLSSGVSIEKDTFKNNVGGIWEDHIAVGNINILDNHFKENKYGIWLVENSSTTAVKRNSFEMMDSISIMCDGFGTSANPNLEISDNTFSNIYFGIALNNITKCKANDNIMNQVKYRGISLENTNNCTFSFNEINAVNYEARYCMKLDMSMGNNINCNQFTKSANGLYSRNTCGNTRLFDNRIGRHYDGIYIDLGSYIGIQKHNWNRWLDSTNYSHFGAVNENTDLNTIQLSNFKVSTQLNTIFHPLNSGNDFFTIDNTYSVINSKECFRIAPLTEERNEDLAMMTSIYTGTDPVWITNSWESKRYVYKEIKDNLNYLTANATLASFYTQNGSTNIGLFYEVGKAINESRFTDANNINSNITTTATYESNLKTVYQYLAQNSLLNASQLQILFAIGNQCPSTGGSAVFMARSIYNSYLKSQNNFDGVDCNPITNRAISNNQSTLSKVNLMPNPVSNVLHINNLPTEKLLNIDILNLQGQVVKSCKMISNDGIFDMKLENIKDGLYFIRISDSNQLITTEKIVVLK